MTTNAATALDYVPALVIDRRPAQFEFEPAATALLLGLTDAEAEVTADVLPPLSNAICEIDQTSAEYQGSPDHHEQEGIKSRYFSGQCYMYVDFYLCFSSWALCAWLDCWADDLDDLNPSSFDHERDS